MSDKEKINELAIRGNMWKGKGKQIYGGHSCLVLQYDNQETQKDSWR